MKALVLFALLFLPAASPPKVEVAKAAPKGLKVSGEVERVLRFSDAAGENYVVFSRRQETGEDGASDYWYVVHAVKAKDGFRILRTVKDWQKGCEFDLVTAFVPEAESVTDLDGDGHAEVTFAYGDDCVSDVSPTNLKLMLIEAGDKYALRGTKRVRVSEKDWMGGDFTADPAFAKAPKAFLAHADKTWAKINGK